VPSKYEILKGKIKRIIEGTDEATKDFLKVIACHRGSIMHESVFTSFKRFREKYGDGKFSEVKNYLIEEGIIFIPKSSCYRPIRFSVKNEKGDYDSQRGEELSKYFGELILEREPKIRKIIEEILKEPEGKEFLKEIAIRKGIHIVNGVEPRIKETIGKSSYEKILNMLLELGIINEYAWSSRKHTYTGYKLLARVDDYIKSKLGIFELEETDKIVLTYIGCINKIFSDLPNWFVWFNYPKGYNYKILDSCKLAQKFLASLIYHSIGDIKKNIEKLQNMGLIREVDLGYTRAGYHRGIILELSQKGKEIATKEESKLMKRIENKIKEIFSDKDNQVIYYLFSRERIPLKILSLIKRSNVDVLVSAGIISEKGDLFLQFNEKIHAYQFIRSGINPENAKRWLKERCNNLLRKEEKQLVGFLSSCKNIVLGKYPDWKSWYSVTSRTQRNYERAYEALIINFPYLKVLFSKLTNLPIEKVDEIVSRLEEKGFLIQEKNTACGFPGYALIYRVPVKFDFEFDLSGVKSKVKEYIQFLAKNIEKNFNQLIFLDYLVNFYERHQCNFLVDSSLIEEQLLRLLNYSPPAEYSPIYAFEDKMIVLYPPIKDELKREIYEIKTKLIESIKNILRKLTEDYQNNIAYNYSEKSKKEGYFILEIESPDPMVGIVSFVITPWITPFDVQAISSLCIKSNTVNLFTFYPKYPQLKSMITSDARYNIIIIREKTVHLFSKKLDQITKKILWKLNEHFKIIEQEEKVKREIEKLEEEFPNLAKVRFIIPEVEDLLRDAIRPRLIKEFGENWQEKIKQRFPKAEEKKQRWEKRHPGEQTDILQGVSIGDFVTLLEDKKFSFIKECFKGLELVKASLQVFLSKKEYHHGKPKNGKDISDEEVDVVNSAFRTLKEMIR